MWCEDGHEGDDRRVGGIRRDGLVVRDMMMMEGLQGDQDHVQDCDAATFLSPSEPEKKTKKKKGCISGSASSVVGIS